MVEAARVTTAQQLLEMPDDGHRHELVRGELRTMSPAGQEHGHVAGILFLSLGNVVRPNRRGRVHAAETGFWISRDPDTVRAPDAAFVSRERATTILRGPGFLEGAPDLAVEVVSPGDSFSEVEEKALDWLAAGTRMVLVVDPRRRTVTVYRARDDVHVLSGGDAIDGADVVPGWELPLPELFAD